MTGRTAEVTRTTRETSIATELRLDGTGASRIQTGLGFLDHMLTTLSRHGRFDIVLKCTGDLEIDDHHTAEDCAIVLGQAFHHALGERRGIRRFASAYAPLDEALARVVVDLSGRPHSTVLLALEREKIGDLSAENATHFFASFANTARCALHVDVLRGSNDHHKVEAAFKAFALALREAVATDGSNDIPSTKESL